MLPYRSHFTVTQARYRGNHRVTFEASICHRWPVPGCSGAFWVLPTRREKKGFSVLAGCPWLTPEVFPQAPTAAFPRVTSAGCDSQAAHPNQLRRNQGIYQHIQHVTVKENIRPTKTIGRAKEESVLPCVRCVAALIWEEMVLVRGKRAPAILTGASLCSAIKLYPIA